MNKQSNYLMVCQNSDCDFCVQANDRNQFVCECPKCGEDTLGRMSRDHFEDMVAGGLDNDIY